MPTEKPTEKDGGKAEELVALDHLYHDGVDYKPGDVVKFGRDDRKLRERLLSQSKVGAKSDWEASQKPQAEASSEPAT
jgi:hypothetical protein